MTTLTLDEALRIARERHIVLVPTTRSVKLWAPGVRVPAEVRQAITTNKKDVLQLLGASDILVCPAPTYHRPGWDWVGGRFVCGYCARMDRAMREAC